VTNHPRQNFSPPPPRTVRVRISVGEVAGPNSTYGGMSTELDFPEYQQSEMDFVRALRRAADGIEAGWRVAMKEAKR
jgi:hypothetical protein